MSRYALLLIITFSLLLVLMGVSILFGAESISIETVTHTLIN